MEGWVFEFPIEKKNVHDLLGFQIYTKLLHMIYVYVYVDGVIWSPLYIATKPNMNLVFQHFDNSRCPIACSCSLRYKENHGTEIEFLFQANRTYRYSLIIIISFYTKHYFVGVLSGRLAQTTTMYLHVIILL